VTRYVVDASVVVKLLVAEAGAAEASALYRDATLIAPDLLLPECANIIWKKQRRGELLTEEAHLAGEFLALTHIELHPATGLVAAATRLAVALDHPAYDCFYLALADREDCALVTADERLVRMAERQGARTPIRLLSSF
jgi:predicted nucleic acid-binding protein